MATRAGRGERARVARRYVHDGLRKVVPFIGVETHGCLMFSSTRDRSVGRALYRDGWWDWNGLPRALDLAGTDLAGRTFVDVGANIGTTTVQAALLGARVIAFEPEPTNYRLLRANVAANLLDDVRCIQVGCSDENGQAQLWKCPINSGDYRVSATGEIEIRLVRLDDVLLELGVERVDMLWMDTQGHEPKVLAGAVGLLTSKPVIVSEFWPAGLGPEGVARFAQQMAGYGTVTDLRTERPTSIGRAAELYHDTETNLMFLPH